MRTYQVREVARLAGVTVRTLHHYDQVGLLVPSLRSGAGYRQYTRDDLLRLQQILLGRELGFSLEQIRRMLDDPEFDRVEALQAQHVLLAERIERDHAILRAIDAALCVERGDTTMSNEDMKQLFDGFDPSAHETEVQARWGDTDAFEASTRRTRSYTKEDWHAIKAEATQIEEAFAEQLRQGARPTDRAVMDIAEQHRQHIDRWFYPCSPNRHAGLGDMYVADARFEAHYEEKAEGLARFIADAVRANATLTRG